jgi:hypothetical protein
MSSFDDLISQFDELSIEHNKILIALNKNSIALSKLHKQMIKHSLSSNDNTTVVTNNLLSKRKSRFTDSDKHPLCIGDIVQVKSNGKIGKIGDLAKINRFGRLYTFAKLLNGDHIGRECNRLGVNFTFVRVD